MRGMASLLLLLFTSCGCGASTSALPEADGVEPVDASRTEMGVIITERQAAAMCDGAGICPQTPSYWTPERDQVEALEVALPRYLATAAPEGSRLRQGLEGYQAQYIGVLRGERELLFANVFCEPLGVDPAERLVVIDGGGDCFFTVEFDPATASFDALRINGES